MAKAKGKQRAPSQKKLARQPDQWAQLRALIQAYADAQEADSWKGGGDPEEMPLREKELELAQLKLNTHIAQMVRYYEGDE
jgi:hypothetical protein